MTLLYFGCAHSLSINLVNDLDYVPQASDVIIQVNNTPYGEYPDSLITPVAKISLDIHLTTTKCSEEDALTILRDKAMAYGGNWISIKNQRDKGYCFLCQAEIYHVNTPDLQFEHETNPRYALNEVLARDEIRKDAYNKAIAIQVTAGLAAIVLIGLLAF